MLRRIASLSAQFPGVLPPLHKLYGARNAIARKHSLLKTTDGFGTFTICATSK